LTIPKSHIFRLWLLVGTFCLTLAELGCLIGKVPRPVLDGLAGGVAPWWDLPAIVHAAAFAIGGWVVSLLGRFLLADVPRLRTGIGRVLAGFLVLLGLFLCLRQFGEMNHVVSRVTDFGTIYRGSEALFAGGDPYEATGNGYFYPPLLAFLFGALTVLPPAGASLLFFSLKFVLVVWALVACDRLVEGRRFVGGRRVLFVFGLVFIAADRKSVV